MIHFSEIENLSSKSGVPREVIEKDYCITWFLIAAPSLIESKEIIFYGGTALKKIYFPDYRFSEDIDFISTKDYKTENILDLMERLYTALRNKVNINFSTEEETIERQGSRLQFFIAYDGFPESGALNKRIKIDFAFGSELFQKPQPKKLYCGYSDMKGLNARLFTYSLEAIVTDKIGTILSANRTEPRDLYDLWFLFKNCNLNYNKVKSIFKSKFGYALDWTTVMPSLHSLIYKERWENRLLRQVANLPDFDKVLKETEQGLKRYLPRKCKIETRKILPKKEQRK